jgi:hypothetical protein
MGKKDSQRQAETITNEQLGILREQNNLQRQNYERSQALMQPAISRLQALISGDRSAALREVAPQLGEIDSGYQAAKDSIFDTIAPGAARDYALSQLERQKATAKSGFMNEATMSAFDKLANLGSGYGSFSLQQLGAALRGGEGASQSNQGLMQNEAARKQAQMSFFGDLAKTAGSMVNPISLGGGGGKAPTIPW